MKDFFILKGGDVELTGVPETIAVLPLGHVVSSKGEFDVDEGSFQAMKAQIAQRGVDLVVDYEHQTLKGVEAPAAGWVKELKLEGGSIVAVVEWTPRGAEYLKNKEYRYLSPVVNVRRADNKAIPARWTRSRAGSRRYGIFSPSPTQRKARSPPSPSPASAP